MSRHSPHDVMRAFAISAELVDLHGDEFLPYFEFMESEVAALQAKSDTASRARAAAAKAKTLGLLPESNRGNYRGKSLRNARDLSLITD